MFPCARNHNRIEAIHDLIRFRLLIRFTIWPLSLMNFIPIKSGKLKSYQSGLGFEVLPCAGKAKDRLEHHQKTKVFVPGIVTPNSIS